MTQALVDNRRNAWKRGGTAVDATSAVEVARQAGLDWQVTSVPIQGYVHNQVSEQETVTDYYEIPKKQGILKLAKTMRTQSLVLSVTSIRLFRTWKYSVH